MDLVKLTLHKDNSQVFVNRDHIAMLVDHGTYGTKLLLVGGGNEIHVKEKPLAIHQQPSVTR